MTSYKFQINKQIMMTQEDIEDHLLGAGAGTYPWWRTIDVTEDGCLLLEADSESDIDGTEPPVSRKMTFDEVAQEIQAMLDNPKCISSIVRGFEEEDIDSDVADLVLQTLLFGNPVFG